MDDEVRERLERIEARIDELIGMVGGGPAAPARGVAAPARGAAAPAREAAAPAPPDAPPSDRCVAERCVHPGEPLDDANSMTVYPKGEDGEPDRSTPWRIHRACLSPARHAVA